MKFACLVLLSALVAATVASPAPFLRGLNRGYYEQDQRSVEIGLGRDGRPRLFVEPREPSTAEIIGRLFANAQRHQAPQVISRNHGGNGGGYRESGRSFLQQGGNQRGGNRQGSLRGRQVFLRY